MARRDQCAGRIGHSGCSRRDRMFRSRRRTPALELSSRPFVIGLARGYPRGRKSRGRLRAGRRDRRRRRLRSDEVRRLGPRTGCVAARTRLDLSEGNCCEQKRRYSGAAPGNERTHDPLPPANSGPEARRQVPLAQPHRRVLTSSRLVPEITRRRKDQLRQTHSPRARFSPPTVGSAPVAQIVLPARLSVSIMPAARQAARASGKWAGRPWTFRHSVG